MAQKIQGAQRDFSSGEIDVALKRSDEHPARKTGLRQMANMRILNSGAVQDRPGRSALFPLANVKRTEEITMAPGKVFKFVFGRDPGNGSLRIFDSTNTQVAALGFQGNAAPLPWTLDTVAQIVFAQFRSSVYITFPGMRPQVVSWNGTAGGGWTIADYNELQVGQKRTMFYRLSPQGVTIRPAAQSGSGVPVVASAAVFTQQHVGTRLRYCNRQMLITAVNPDGTIATVTIMESLPGGQILTLGSIDPSSTFSLGDAVTGSATGSRAIVTNINVAAFQISVQLITQSATPSTDPFNPGTVAFTASDTVVGPGGGQKISAVSTIGAPQSVTFWDDEVMNSMRGFPASCFVDQFRLGFCNFPALPEGIAWSAINSPNDLYVGASPSDAIFELAPDKVQVFYVVPGAESSEFVFCDKRLYYIRIDAANPLKPGSVGFQTLSSDGCAQVQPRPAQELILYINAGRNSVMAILALGAYNRPFSTKNLCEYHSHLFTDIAAIAAPTADGTFNERYAYVMNVDGSVVIGKYTLQNGQVAGTVGWGPWSGAGAVQWVSALGSNVLFTTTYFGAQTIVETLDDTRYLDGALFVNNLPAAFAPSAGRGPLYWARSQLVSLMDQGTRSMGTYQIDENGFIIPQNNGGEDLTAATLVAGLPWTSVVEPFCPDAQPGQDMQQRMRKRRVARLAAYVLHSSGFVMARLFSGPLTPTSPALGAMMNYRRFPAYNQDDNATLPPPSRETTERWRPLGRSFDPRAAIIKDTPGPLQVLEIGIEATI